MLQQRRARLLNSGESVWFPPDATSGVRLRTGRVTNWRHGQMVLRWAAAAYLDTEKNLRRIMGDCHLWMLKAALDEQPNTEEVRIA